MPTLKIVTIVGARPQFIKAALVSRAIAQWNEANESPTIDERIVHTGQHFDANMSDVFFAEMSIPVPHRHLGIAGGGHGEMTGRMLQAIEPVLIEEQPDWVLIYGDTNSTLAGALAASKLHIPVAHVEAGLRSFNRKMPEEINRIVADHASDLLLSPTTTACGHLQRESIPESRIALVGDVMYDAMLFYRDMAAAKSSVLQDQSLPAGGYVLATVHRAENTDDATRLKGIVDGLCSLADRMPVVLPLHPRTRGALERAGLTDRATRALQIIKPVGYLDMVQLEANAALIATDSGGVQKEAYFNRVPCITLRDETEWTELVEANANRLVRGDAASIVAGANAMLGQTIEDGNLYGDGHAGAKIIKELVSRGGSSLRRRDKSRPPGSQ